MGLPHPSQQGAGIQAAKLIASRYSGVSTGKIISTSSGHHSLLCSSILQNISVLIEGGLLILTKHPRNPPKEEETLRAGRKMPATSSPGGRAPTAKGPPNTTSVTNYNKRKTKTFDHASPTVPGKMTNSGLHLGADEVQEMRVVGKGDLGGIDGVPSLGTHGARLWVHILTGTHLGKAPCRCPLRPLETLSGP